MQCKCGGETTNAIHPRVRNKKVTHTLEYFKCRCGRQGPLSFYRVVDGKKILISEEQAKAETT